MIREQRANRFNHNQPLQEIRELRLGGRPIPPPPPLCRDRTKRNEGRLPRGGASLHDMRHCWCQKRRETGPEGEKRAQKAINGPRKARNGPGSLAMTSTLCVMAVLTATYLSNCRDNIVTVSLIPSGCRANTLTVSGRTSPKILPPPSRNSEGALSHNPVMTSSDSSLVESWQVFNNEHGKMVPSPASRVR